MRYTSWAACFLLPALLAAGGARADESGLYAGIGVGAVRSELSGDFSSRLSAGFGGIRLSQDKSDIAARVLLGYRINRHLALEGGWGDYGKVDGRAETSFPLGRVTIERQTRAFSLDAVGTLPLGERLELTGKIGAAFWRVENSTTTVLPVSSVAVNNTREQSGSSPHVGIGLQYRLSDTVRLSLDIESFRAGKDGDTGRSHVNTAFAGLKFNF